MTPFPVERASDMRPGIALAFGGASILVAWPDGSLELVFPAELLWATAVTAWPQTPEFMAESDGTWGKGAGS